MPRASAGRGRIGRDPLRGHRPDEDVTTRRQHGKIAIRGRDEARARTEVVLPDRIRWCGRHRGAGRHLRPVREDAEARRADERAVTAGRALQPDPEGRSRWFVRGRRCVVRRSGGAARPIRLTGEPRASRARSARGVMGWSARRSRRWSPRPSPPPRVRDALAPSRAPFVREDDGEDRAVPSEGGRISRGRARRPARLGGARFASPPNQWSSGRCRVCSEAPPVEVPGRGVRSGAGVRPRPEATARRRPGCGSAVDALEPVVDEQGGPDAGLGDGQQVVPTGRG